MAALLKAEPNLKVLVVGHTDNVGTFQFNEDLSKRRAKAVVAELAASHGIAAERMLPLGASFMAPVSTNSTEEGGNESPVELAAYNDYNSERRYAEARMTKPIRTQLRHLHSGFVLDSSFAIRNSSFARPPPHAPKLSIRDLLLDPRRAL